jgi:hypothetical protein
VAQIRNTNPPGRFLKPDDPINPSGYVEIGDLKAWKKAGQALREDAPDVRKEIIEGVLETEGVDFHMKNLDQMELDGLRQLLKMKREAAKYLFNHGEVQAVIRMINKKQNDIIKDAEEGEDAKEQEIEESFGGSQPLYRHRQLQEEVRIVVRGGKEELTQQHKQRGFQEVDMLMKTDQNDAPPAPATTTMMPIINKAYLQRLNSNLESEQRYLDVLFCFRLHWIN